MKKIIKLLNSCLFVFFICFTVLMFLNFNDLKISKILLVLCILPVIMLPYILDKIKIYHMDEVLLFIYYIFILLSLILGSILGFYHKIWWFDLLCHFRSGCLTVIVAFVVLQKNHLVHINY